MQYEVLWASETRIFNAPTLHATLMQGMVGQTTQSEWRLAVLGCIVGDAENTLETLVIG